MRLYCSKSERYHARTIASATIGASDPTTTTKFLEEKDDRKRARLFVTTLNCGGIRGMSGLGGRVEEWIPEGYDMYCIGLQECLIFKELRYRVRVRVRVGRQ